ncbi:MAG: Na/Pi cotransporter family protein [Candidatus Spyradocola sp.]|jgi:phosphate:Na+ symporter
MTWQDLTLLGGGLGLFLFGMKEMGDGLERAAGNSLQRFLEVLTRNRFLGLLTGLVFTMLVQSSSATTAMVVGFVRAGFLDLHQAVGVIFGANLGTTITAQLVALPLSGISPVLLLVGALVHCFARGERLRELGGVLTGFGLLFVGLSLMGDSLAGLRDRPEVTRMLAVFARTPFLGVCAGLAVTALLQSSSASIGLLQILAAQGVIGLDSAIYVLMGQNIGTTVTAFLASAGGGRIARRAALLHLLFNLLGTLLVSALLRLFPVTAWLAALSPGDPMRQIANAHTLFNACTILFLFPFQDQLVRWTERLLPDRRSSLDLAR